MLLYSAAFCGDTRAPYPITKLARTAHHRRSNCYNTTDPPNPPPGLSGGRTFAHWEQLRLIRAFDGGPEEATFILIHSEIESHTPDLIAAYDMVLDGLVGSSVPDVGMGLTRLVEVLERIVVSQVRTTMHWRDLALRSTAFQHLNEAPLHLDLRNWAQVHHFLRR